MASETVQPARRRAWLPRRRDAAVGESKLDKGADLRVIEPAPVGWRALLSHTASELWHNRAAFLFFTKRYARKRYGRTFFGYLWFVIPYVLPLFLGALVFGGILG